MPESVRIGFSNAGCLAMMTEQRTKDRSRHSCSPCAPFQTNKQSRTGARRALQEQVVLEEMNRFGSQWQKANLIPFAAHADLRF